MAIREQVKEELENVPEEYLHLVYRILRALETPRAEEGEMSWSEFVAATYGCMADAPIERGDQGEFEVREPLR